MPSCACRIELNILVVQTDFVHGHDSADFGTRSYKDVKVLRQDGSVAIENDTKWDYLTEVAKRMASAGKRKQGNVEAAS